MDQSTPFSTFQDEASAALIDTTKTAVSLAAEDLPFHRSFDPVFASSLDQCSSTILSLINSLLHNAAAGTDLEAPKLRGVKDVETQWKDIVEIVDFLLEKADICLDEYTGAIKQKNPEAGPNARRDYPRKLVKPDTVNTFKTRNIAKPQLKFRTKIDNHDNSSWKPILTSKPHALVPLAECLRPFVADNLQMQYHNPYRVEIENMAYPNFVYETRKPIDYQPLDTTKAIFVDSNTSLVRMLKDLKQATELAVDLEHHSDRSFVGFVCLMQISTRKKDWIIDTLKLREELEMLNEVFTDPQILKVFHGANMDITWLQRDFGLYVVGLFDTFYAANSLGFPSKSLAYLLKTYASFDADKKYQLADWRIRPLPQEMLDYARSDTHFLLYCYDNLRNQLIQSSTPGVDLMEEVLTKSKETALKRYERDVYDASEGFGQFGWKMLLKRMPATFTPEQLTVFKAIHQWRDKVARDDDESRHYVMPKNQLYNLARLMPEDIPGILNACHPVSPPTRLRVSEILSIIRTTKNDKQAKLSTPLFIAEAAELKISSMVSDRAKDTLSIFDDDGTKTSRTNYSSFWGGSFGSSKWLASAKASLDVRLSVPLPPLTAAIFVEPSEPTPAVAQLQQPGSRAEHEFTRRRSQKDDNIIVVMQVGKKRKRGNSGDDTLASEEVEKTLDLARPELHTINEDIATEIMDRLETSLQIKKKKVKGAEGSASSPNSKEHTPLRAFDYATAPSILKGGGKFEDRVFNPYKHGTGGPQGGKKGRREKEGRSKTFKS